ncbi:MAG: aminomethyl transferase family protein, partial [Desulfobacterales bacterium]
VLPLSHQDIGPWPFINHPWPFALPYNEDRSAFTKNFLGADALRANPDADFTYPFVGHDLRKVTTDGQTRVLDSRGEAIGTVLTCATDMGIGTHEGRILSVASPDRPPEFTPKGLACGFVKVKNPLSPGDEVVISDPRRHLPVTIVSDIRPDRTARRPLKDTL